MSAIVGLGSAFPPTVDQAEMWNDFFADHFTRSRVARRVWQSAGVDRRHSAIDPRVIDLSEATTAERMARFVDLAVPLACRAARAAIEEAGAQVDDLGSLTVASCTGYATPGVDILVAQALGMRPSVQRLHIGHMGCYAAIPAVAATSDGAAARGRLGLVVCVELTSLHIQPRTDDTEQIVAHALFSDAAAAAVVAPSGQGLEVVDVVARTDASTADLMTWDITDRGFRMRLSPKVPRVLEAHVRDTVCELLGGHGLDIGEVDRWAIHPGGPRIIDAVARMLDLEADDVAVSRDVLRAHGNCSSATALLVLEALRHRSPPEVGQHVVALAFGPGLTLYAMLLRAC